MEIMVIDFEKLKGALSGKQSEIAAMLGVHVNTINRKINQKGRLHLDDLNKIAVALGRNTSEFITEVEINSNHLEHDNDGWLKSVKLGNPSSPLRIDYITESGS